MPPEARVLTTLPRIDYTDAFQLTTTKAGYRTAEEWARALLEDAPAVTRRALRRGWLALGLRLGSTGDGGRILGWEIRRTSPDFVLVGARSLLEFEGEVLIKREPQALLLGTFIQLKNPLARLVWTAMAPHHRKVLPHLLKQVSRRAGNELS